MINAWWQELAFAVQEGAEGEWSRVVDTNLVDSFVDAGVPLHAVEYTVAPRSVVVLVRAKKN
jgi:pullulanase/glycogen debranching enzyme